MKNYIFSVVFFFFISITTFSQDIPPVIEPPVGMEYVVTKEVVNNSILGVTNEAFLEGLDSLVLSKGLHKIKILKDYKYSIHLGGEHLYINNEGIDKCKIITVTILSKKDDYFTGGIFFRNNVMFSVLGEHPENPFFDTGETIKQELLRIKNYQIKGPHDFPLWILYYSDGKLSLLHEEFTAYAD